MRSKPRAPCGCRAKASSKASTFMSTGCSRIRSSRRTRQNRCTACPRKVPRWRPRLHRPRPGCKEKMMQLIKAIVRPNKVDDVKAALEKMGVSGMTVTEVRGHGQQKGHTAIYRGKEYNVSLLPKMQIETVVTESVVDATIEAIVAAARTGEIGDGRVFVTPVAESYRIRTGEQAP